MGGHTSESPAVAEVEAAAAAHRRSGHRVHAALAAAAAAGLTTAAIARALDLSYTTTARWIEQGPPDPWKRRQ